MYKNQKVFFIGASRGRIKDYLKNKSRFWGAAQSKIKEIEKLFPHKGKLLDLGCAGGLFLDVARDSGWDVQGIEPSKWGKDIATRYLNLDVIQGTLQTVRPTKIPFDVVTFFDVIEHLQDPLTELQRIKSVLKENGLLVVTTPNIESFVAKALGISWSMITLPEHLFYFSPETLSKMLKKSGFKVEKIETRNSDIPYNGVQLIKKFLGKGNKELRFVSNEGVEQMTSNANVKQRIGHIIGHWFYAVAWLLPYFRQGEGLVAYARKV